MRVERKGEMTNAYRMLSLATIHLDIAVTTQSVNMLKLQLGIHAEERKN